MSRTLTLIQTGWESIRAAADQGRTTDALARLERLLARPDVPATIVLEGHRLAGSLALALGRFATARKHLRVAAALDPAHAPTRFDLGRAWEDDPSGCDRRAAAAFRRAVRLDQENPLYRAAFGRAASRCGKERLGAREMLAATGIAPERLDVARIAVRGLLELGKVAAARKVLEKATFLNPRHPELVALEGRLRFEAARLGQKHGRDTRAAQDAPFATDGDRVSLPFIRLAGTAAPASGTDVRADVLSFPRPHLARVRLGRADG